MQEPYLEITFRHGRPLAAYYYLPRPSGARAARTRRVEPGLIIDYSEADQPIGIEITAPGRVTLETFNALLTELGVRAVAASEFAPLHAA
jgi:hypothetical protein